MSKNGKQLRNTGDGIQIASQAKEVLTLSSLYLSGCPDAIVRALCQTHKIPLKTTLLCYFLGHMVLKQFCLVDGYYVTHKILQFFLNILILKRSKK